LVTKLRDKWTIAALLIAYVCIQSYCLQRLTINYDEGLFSYYGTTLLKLEGDKDIVKFDSKLPITALNMLPRAVVQLFHPGLKRTDAYKDIMMGRYVSLLVALLLALLIYHWSALLYGTKAGLASFIIFLLCPNFLAHGVFVSSDIFACLFMTASLYFLWQFSQAGQTKHWLMTSGCVALAQITKFSMIHLFIVFPLLVAVMYFLKGRIFPGKPFNKIKLIKLLLLFAGINWLVICAAHLFYGMFIPLNNYTFRSGTLQHLQAFLRGAGKYLPVPFPSSYIQSLDMVIYLDHLGAGQAGSSQGSLYITGNSSRYGFWYYYFVVLWYKLPLSVLLVLGASFYLYIKKWNKFIFVKNELYLLVPVIYFLIYMSFFYSTQIGIRHILIILPLLYVFAGFLFQQAYNYRAARYLVYASVLYQCISVGIFFPHFLPYTNEMITDKKMAYKKIADTNLCYGEGGRFLQTYLQQHPGAKYLPPGICSGKIVMEVNEMLNIDIATVGKYNWVNGLTPSDHIHSQYLIFDISPALADSLAKVHF